MPLLGYTVQMYEQQSRVFILEFSICSHLYYSRLAKNAQLKEEKGHCFNVYTFESNGYMHIQWILSIQGSRCRQKKTFSTLCVWRMVFIVDRQILLIDKKNIHFSLLPSLKCEVDGNL